MARLSVVVLLALATMSLRAQNQPTFRTGANYVRVDMYATRDGQPIEDLKAAEVDVLEDGVLQTIEAFEHVKVRTTSPEASRIEPNTIQESRQLAGDPRGRVFVIFLDTYHTQIEGSANMRQPLINFLDRVLGPDDLVAMMTPEMAATEITFGRKTTVIANILQREWLWGRRGRLTNIDNDDKEDEYAACYALDMDIAREMKARRREKLTLDALQDLMVHLAGIREERKAVLAVTEGWQLFKPNTQLARRDQQGNVRPGDVLMRPPRPQPSDAGQIQGSMRVTCEADRMALAQIDHETRLRELTEDANRENVTFYPVYARGLVPFDSPIGPEKPPSLAQDAANLRARQDSLRFIADGTDGTAVINTNNIDGALRRIVDDLSSYYLMGYYATNTKLDGKFRSITVRVKRDGARVRARRGYRARGPGDLSSSAPGANTPALSPAISAALTPAVSFNARAQFRIRASSWTRPSDGGGTAGTFWIVGELDAQTRRQPAWTAGAQADVAVIGPDGKPVASRMMDVRPGTGAFALQIPESGGVASGEYTVRVRLRSPADGELALSDTQRVTVKEATTLGEALVSRRGLSTGTQYLRTADPRFVRSDRIRLEHATTATEPATARLLDRNGTALSVPAQVSERLDPSAGIRWIVIDATLAPLAPGDYAVEVAQGEARQLTGFRLIP
ncbi:MAG TPA: VWA domain-containing protein [Vicinamibacterales bacterium]|nr:VWA domain-containing protein [Vicinamibacterales bacterium]